MKTPVCSTKNMPGGDTCLLPRGHAGLHDWQGGRPEGGRHAKDFFGRSLYVGDIVATLKPKYRYALARGKITNITPKALRVRIDGAKNDTTVFESQVVKHWRQG